MSLITKLYQHHCYHKCCPDRWSRFPNHKEDQNGLEKSISDDSIIHRHTFDDNEWNTESFTIQNPAMRELLETALAQYQDLDLALEEWTFRPPFMPIVHRWDRLHSLSDAKANAPAPEASTQLMEFLHPILAPQIDALAKTRETGSVMFKDLCQIFAPHEFVVTRFYEVEAVCRVTKYKFVKSVRNPDCWEIGLEYVDWNGHHSGYARTKVVIKDFSGYRRVVSLPVYPLHFNAHGPAIRKRLIKRGRKFEALRGYHFQTCSGTKILLLADEPEQRPVSGRVIIDAHAYYLANDKVKPDLTSLIQDEKPNDKESSSDNSDTQSSVSSDSDPMVEGNADMMIKPVDTTTGRSEILKPLTDDMCLVTNPWVKGLDLKTKEWALFCVNDLAPVTWNDAAFENLVLPGPEKQLAREFVESKALANNFDDFIQDKGRGIIILMFGPPGVGKTFTAESVAEQARVPLYCMSAGDLGTVPEEVELSLDRALSLCGLWNAIILLDEADVFLGARTDNDLTRNELVAVFLTKLEYYKGVCFLTTNRTGSIDPAFQSRIDLFLPYKDLTFEAREKVWRNFITRVGGDEFTVSDEEMNSLAKIELNGREIKNLIKSAHLLSLKSGGVLQADRLLMLAQNRVAALDALKEK
ncbi:related to TOB3 (member of AAA-ATPase family) [Fusarium torulosum]|uniref:Related to TOB3 (Member of AAA-ATPase family) n=1 Tax=Fusarium torulosum TaxID=33205 RepID=A0AAE8M080_9HYPO|nr:related to TOB3 (member of AAA-ATPase family) [Fusarium torulosum]